MKKQCFICKDIKNLKQFYTHKKMPDGYVNKCIKCTKEYINHRRVADRAGDIKRKMESYRNDYKTLWNVRYHGMKTRVSGTSINKHRSSFGKELCSKKDFFHWCQKNINTFDILFANWKKFGYNRKFSPSIDRIKNNKGYTLDNIQWVTQQENSLKK